MANKSSIIQSGRVATGISGLDEILCGGLIPNRTYLIRGGPGTGKTTMGIHFLSAGASLGEKVLFISLGEHEKEVRANAEGLDLTLAGVNFLDLGPGSSFFSEAQNYDIFSISEVEREPMTRRIIETVTMLRPSRVFVDATTQFKYLSPDALQYRKQMISFMRYLMENGTTACFTSESTLSAPDDDLQFISDAVINLMMSEYGRAVEITKFHGSPLKRGKHAFEITSHGLEVFPKLRPIEHARGFKREILASGNQQIDQLLGGGLERGTTTLLTGPAGVGKTTLGIQFMKEAARRNERSVIYTFEENRSALIQKAEATGTPIIRMLDQGNLSIVYVEPLLYSADEIAHLVRREVEEHNSRMIMIDGIAGYTLSVRGDNLEREIRSLWKYLTNMGVTVLAINETEAITGDFKATEVGISYMADNILFLRYLELDGEMNKAIGVLKKRFGDFERRLREFTITSQGIMVGEPLKGLRGILRGAPDWFEAHEHKTRKAG